MAVTGIRLADEVSSVRWKSQEPLRDEGHAFHLDQGAKWQLRNLDGRAWWWIDAEGAAVDGVERREVVEVREKAGGLDDAVKPGACRIQHRGEILHDSLGLKGHVAVDDRHRLRVEWQLPRGEDEAIGHNSLRIGPDRRGRSVRGHNRPFHSLRHPLVLPHSN